jgi:predicted polyphosphate/ATP-dependent NAD kinase
VLDSNALGVDPMPKRRLGLIVNPIAGLGGTVALNGSDGVAAEALRRGATPRAGLRASEALRAIVRDTPDLEFWCYDDAMGGSAARDAGIEPHIVGTCASSSTALDTQRAARDLMAAGIDLLLFAGGDGTACDLVDAVGLAVPVLGIPAGVKMHSSVFATTPAAAGTLAALFLTGGERAAPLGDADIMDVDEAARIRGVISTRLHGALHSPTHGRLRQNPKAGVAPAEPAAVAALASTVAAQLDPTTLYLLGPGTTMAAVKSELGLRGTLLGVDAVRGRRPIGFNLSEREILALLESIEPVKLIVSPLGGQGFVFGRGNQQISAPVLRRIGRGNIVLVSTMAKLLALGGSMLLVDTGDAELDAELAGWYRIVVGTNQSTVYRIAA